MDPGAAVPAYWHVTDLGAGADDVVAESRERDLGHAYPDDTSIPPFSDWNMPPIFRGG